MSEYLEKVNRLHSGWMIGNSDAPRSADLPDTWLLADSEPFPGDSSLLAVALFSQSLQLLQLASPPDSLESRALLPGLDATVLPDKYRALFRRIVNNKDYPEAFLVNLLAQRGHHSHPADWMPRTHADSLPPLYSPWLQWLNQSGANTEKHAELSSDSWDDFCPAERLAALKEIRVHSPAQARQLLQDCVSREKADARYNLLHSLQINLSEEDVEYLRLLDTDRSTRIRDFAKHCLARLGELHLESDDSSLGELTELLDVKKSGVIKRRPQLIAKKLKNQKLAQSRAELLESTPFTVLAQALKLEPFELAAAWKFNAERESRAFLTGAALTAPDECISVLIDHILNETGVDDAINYTTMLLNRLNDPQKQSLLDHLLHEKKHPMLPSEALRFSPASAESLSWKKLRRTRMWSELRKATMKDLEDNGYLRNYHTGFELFHIGCLLPMETALAVLQDLTEGGVHSADPALDAIKLNTQLTGS